MIPLADLIYRRLVPVKRFGAVNMNSYSHSVDGKRISEMGHSPWDFQCRNDARPKRVSPNAALFTDDCLSGRGHIREGLQPFHLRPSSVAILKGLFSGLFLGCMVVCYFLLKNL